MGVGLHLCLWQGWLYVAFVAVVCARRIVGWWVSTDFVLDALEPALHDRQPAAHALTHHSDRSSSQGTPRQKCQLPQNNLLESRGGALLTGSRIRGDFKALRAPPWSGPEPDQVDDNVQMITASGYRKYFFHVVLCLTAWSWSVHSGAQTSSPSKAQAGLALPSGASAKKVDEFLATLRPPTSIQALESGNDLLLDLPDIAAAGPVRVNAISTMPGTDGMWLLSLSPQPESGAALFAAVTLAPASLPDTTFLLNLTKTQPILLIARAGGKYYGLQREIKIGIPTLNVKKN